MPMPKAQIIAMEKPGSADAPSATWQTRTGRVLTALSVVFLLFDAAGKFMKPVQVVQAFERLGLPMTLSPTVGVLITLSTVLYAIPRTAVLGAVLLTAFLGGAISIQMRAGSSTFETVFPAILGVTIWAGIYLRDCRLRQVFPMR